MHKLLRELVTHWRLFGIPGEANVTVAVSGGADSCALLSALAELRENGKISNGLVAAHYNHALRGEESDRDEAFCLKLAGNLDIEFISDRMNSKGTAGNLEQVLRDARYEFLYKTAIGAGSDIILTGHTVNDQAETVLLNLVRGSGIEGLSGMPVKRPLFPGSEVRLIRPMLRWAHRSLTEEFCMSREIAFRHDITNDDESLSRVRIRKSIIPALQSLNPRIVESLSRTAQTLFEHRVAAEWLIEQNPEINAIAKGSALSIKELKKLPEAVRRVAVRRWLLNQLGSLRKIGAAHLEAIDMLATSRKSGKTVELPGNIRVVKNSGKLELSGSKVEK